MEPTELDTKTLFDLALQHWHKPFGLFIAIVAMLFLDIFLVTSITDNWIIGLISYIVTIVGVTFLWKISNRIPVTKANKVGIVVCISSSNDNDKNRIREDFIISLRGLIKSGLNGNSFDFIEIPQHISENILDLEGATLLKQKTKSHFVIYGRVRLRKINGIDCYHLDLEGLVGHGPIDSKISSKLSSEFAELFPRKVIIPSENDLLSFTFTSEWTEFVAKYIIGIAAFCTNDLDYAESLYVDLQKRLSYITSDFPVFVKLKQRLPVRISEIYSTKASRCLLTWAKTKDSSYIPLLTEYLDKINKNSSAYEVLLLRSIEAFLNGRNIKKSKLYLKRCKSVNDYTWHFNLSFIEAYSGNLLVSTRHYKICAKFIINPETLAQIEDFLCWILKEEPDKYQYYYCLGFFNREIKGDNIQALEDFRKFVNLCRDGEFQKEKIMATNWIQQLENHDMTADFTEKLL